MRIECKNPEAVVKRAFYLAWKACGGTHGLGWLQDRGSDMSEDQVWNAVFNSTDYPGGGFNNNKPGKVYGDYVFGRMMKMGLKWSENWVESPGIKPRLDYQAWCDKYDSYETLINAAIESLKNVSA